MAFQKGKSGNPKGRPPKTRALTAILETALNAKGEQGTHKRAIADMVVEAITSGSVTFPDGRTLALDLPNWLDLTRWLYGHVDGAAPQQVDVGNSGEVVLKVIYEGSRGTDTAQAASPEAG